MIALVQADDTKQIFDGIHSWVDIPDLKLPPNIAWRSNPVPGFAATQIHMEHDGRTSTMQLRGPFLYEMSRYYIVSGPARILGVLKSSLGGQAVSSFTSALRRDPGLVTWAIALGFKPLLNSQGKRVGMLPPDGTVLAGYNGVDLDGDDIEDAVELGV